MENHRKPIIVEKLVFCSFLFDKRLFRALRLKLPAVVLLARLLILIKKGGLLQLKFGVVGVGVGVNIYLWAR